MSNTSRTDASAGRRDLLAMALVAAVPGIATATAPLSCPAPESTGSTMTDTPLSARQLAIGPIAASMAAGHLPALAVALTQGLDAGLSVAEAKEVLVQLYAYTGFPRALNALEARWRGRPRGAGRQSAGNGGEGRG